MKTIFLTAVCASALAAADVRININLGGGHPLLRPARTVIVRRPPVVVVTETRVVYAPVVLWERVVAEPPPRHRMVWEDNETFHRNEDWVDTHFKVGNTGEGLVLRIAGRLQIDFAEVRFGHGQVQVVDFHEKELDNGTFRLLDFAAGRTVVSLRMVARARSPEANAAVLMRK